MAMMSRGECQWVHWVRGVRETPWTVGGVEVVDMLGEIRGCGVGEGEGKRGCWIVRLN
jgi:hypothetical protein